jgi:3D (Asp-Asp-Asp) domain-containing protein
MQKIKSEWFKKIDKTKTDNFVKDFCLGLTMGAMIIGTGTSLIADRSLKQPPVDCKAINTAPQQPIKQDVAPIKPKMNLKQASVTKYGWTGNKMANGEYPYPGAVAVSDRTIPLGTQIELDGKRYVVADRTAKWIHEKFGLTVDIYSDESEMEMINFGRKNKIIKILN